MREEPRRLAQGTTVTEESQLQIIEWTPPVTVEGEEQEELLAPLTPPLRRQQGPHASTVPDPAVTGAEETHQGMQLNMKNLTFKSDIFVVLCWVCVVLGSTQTGI